MLLIIRDRFLAELHSSGKLHLELARVSSIIASRLTPFMATVHKALPTDVRSFAPLRPKNKALRHNIIATFALAACSFS